MEQSDVDRIARFEQHFAQAQATDVVELAWGFALLNRDFPSSHDHNRIVVNSAATSADVIATAESVLGGAGRKHRFISVVDDALGRALRPDFVAAGYEHETITTMIYRGVETVAPAHQVRAVPLDVLRPALARDWRILLPDSTDDVCAQLADRTALYANGAEVTRLAVFDGEEIAARADLYVDHGDGIAQFENLFTHPDYRGRGYGEALVREAQSRGRDAGCQLSFLGADLDDWPCDWYRRLGYVDERRTHNFTRV